MVRLHIGAPKTGTTYLQGRLSRNAASLARAGIHYPSGRRLQDAHVFHFRAALDLLGQDWGGPPGHAKGAWAQMLREVDRSRGEVLISHEILAAAATSKIRRALHDLGDHEVHLIYTARDLGRVIPAAWQESLKQGGHARFRSFVRGFDRPDRGPARPFDLPAVLERWGELLPPERISVVVVPQSPAPEGDGLWERFCAAAGIDPADAPIDTEVANTSLRVAEAQVLRRLNRALERRLGSEGEADELVLELVRRGEFGTGASARISLPPQRYDWAMAESERWIDWLKGSGVTVFGDPEGLRPRLSEPGTPWVDPDRVRSKVVTRAAVHALASMTQEAARRTDPEQGLGPRLRRGIGRIGRRG